MRTATQNVDEIVRTTNPRRFWDRAVTDLFDEPDDATPLTPEEKNGLLQAHITYRWELNEAEQQNIYRAQEWALARRRDLLTDKFVKDLHRRMLGEVWRVGRKVQNERTQPRDQTLRSADGRPAVAR